MFNKDIILATVMTLTMLSVIGFACTLFAGAFFVQALGVPGALALPLGFGVLAGVGKVIVDRMEA